MMPDPATLQEIVLGALAERATGARIAAETDNQRVRKMYDEVADAFDEARVVLREHYRSKNKPT